MLLVPLLILIDSSKGEATLKEELQKYVAEKKRLEKSSLVIDVFFDSKQCNSWVCDTRSVGMSVIQCNTIQELQWPERLAKDVVTMRIGN